MTQIKIDFGNCVGCPPGRCTGYSGCPKCRVIDYYCDICGEEISGERFSYGGDDLCESCAEEFVNDELARIDIGDKLQMLEAYNG